MSFRYCAFLLPVLLGWVLSSCKPTRHVAAGDHLLVKNVIHLNENGLQVSEVGEEELKTVLKQKPNRRILGFIPFHLSVWNYANSRDQDRKRNQYLKNTIGEAPVLYEPVLLEKSRDQLQRHLKNNGYFEAEVSAYAMLDKKTAELHFFINTGPAYTLRRLSYAFEDTSLIKEFSGGVKTSLTSGDRFDADQFERERTRLTNTMKDLGYYTFEQIHVVFDIDTNMPGTRFDAAVRLRNQRKPVEVLGKDTVIEESHKKHRIREVVINQDFEAARSGRVRLDSTHYRGLVFYYLGKPAIKPTRLEGTVFVRPGEYYAQSKSQYTYERINALGNFRFIDLKYEPVPSPGNVPELDLRINLREAPKQAITVETVGTNRSGNLGISASLNYKNKNLFRGAEQLDWKVYGGLEAQRTNSTIDGQDAEVIRLTPFNTYEFGAQVGLTVPDFVVRFKREKLPWFKEPRTTHVVSVDRQVRPQYDRNLINLSYQMSMRLRQKDQLTVAPLDLSVIRLHKDPEFEQLLLRTNNSLLINSYNNHLILATRLSYANTTQELNKLVNFHYYRLNLESAGNSLRLVAQQFNMRYDSDKNSYLIDSVAFAQYVKFDMNFVRHLILTENSRYVYRFFGGLGVPLKNLNTLPFERSFFAGGSNGIRAWQARGLGPGSLADTATYGIDQVGEFQLELNLEYRFPIFNQVEGAVFSDFGNIWLLRYDPLRPGANFDPKRFYREIAIAPGAGVRLNFNFFVFRLDFGLQMKDPALPAGERWAFQPKTLTNAYRAQANVGRMDAGLSPIERWTRPQTTLNFAIDYPF